MNTFKSIFGDHLGLLRVGLFYAENLDLKIININLKRKESWHILLNKWLMLAISLGMV